MVAPLPTTAEITTALHETLGEWHAHRTSPAHSRCDASCRAKHDALVDALLEELWDALKYADA